MHMLIAIIGMGVLFTGCTTAHELAGGKYLVPRAIEERSFCGVTANYSWVEECDGMPDPKQPGMLYKNCVAKSAPQLASAQGPCGQIISGALSGAMTLGGFGLLSTAGGGSVTSQGGNVTTSTIINQVTGSHGPGNAHK